MTTRHTVTKTELFSWDFCLRADWCKECISTYFIEVINASYLFAKRCPRVWDIGHILNHFDLLEYNTV